MFSTILETLSKEFSGPNAKDLINGIANYHRIQSSPGFRAAAKYCYEKLEGYAIPSVELLTFPAKGDNKYWGVPVPKEWEIKNASLDLIEPKEKAKNLCRFLEDPCSIIQRSKGTPAEGIQGEVVILQKNLTDDEIAQLDLEGKFVLTDDPDLRKLREVVVKKGKAAGIIYDLVSELKPIRTRANFPTARRYTSFWYGPDGSEGDALGFVLSAELGDELRALVKQLEKEGEKKEQKQKVRVRAKIKARFYDGTMEVVDFFIPGEKEDEEVLAVAHLCHPKPGAIDNASGCGTLIEVARSLHTLIEIGKLPKPKRGIRFLLVAEFTGTICYLATHEKKIGKFVAGINADMVGADQTVGDGRTLIMERTHDACPSFVNDVLSAILSERSKEVPNFTKTSAVATFKFANDQPFSGGSDHLILGFPDIGIGSPMLIQWPDRYYHTGEDTIEKVSTNMLKIVGTLIGTYCYFIANAGYPEVLWLIQEVGNKGRERILRFSREYVNTTLKQIQREETREKKEKILNEFLKKVEKRMIFRRDREILTLQSVKKLLSKKDDLKNAEKLIRKEEQLTNEVTERELVRVKELMTKLSESLGLRVKKSKEEEEPSRKNPELLAIPVKKYRGAITGLHRTVLDYKDYREYSNLVKKNEEMATTIDSAIYWIDGKRTINEICELIDAEFGKVDREFLLKMLKFYEKHGFLKLKKKKEEAI